MGSIFADAFADGISGLVPGLFTALNPLPRRSPFTLLPGTSGRAMSDKTKRLRDDARIRQQYEEGLRRAEAQAMANPIPKCLCGLTYRETEIVAADQGRWRPTAFYCRVCAPADVRALCWP